MVFLEFNDPYSPPRVEVDTSCSLRTLALVSSIAAAVQYGWALQLSLLTPYIQLLGVPHKWAAIVWLCGPISGLLIQPTIGHYSDHCTSRFGRRRPFIVIGAFLLCIGVFLIGFAADIGFSLGDSLETTTKPRAVVAFVIGFWILDISNNIVQGPCRALLADLSGNNEAKLMVGNALFAFFMAVGNIIGYGLGSYMEIFHLLPFTKTEACEIYCANLKTCFILSIFFVSIVTTMVVTVVKEDVFNPYPPTYLTGEVYMDEYKKEELSFFGQLALALGSLSKPMRNLLIVTSLNWIGWFPFTMFSTDWMGKEVYGGEAAGDPQKVAMYHAGVWAGTKGLMLYVVSLGFVSLFMEPLVRLTGNVKRLWGASNFILAFCMVLTACITDMAKLARTSATGPGSSEPPAFVKITAWTLFFTLGIPQAVSTLLLSILPLNLKSFWCNLEPISYNRKLKYK